MPTDGNELSVPDLARMLDVRGKGYQAGPAAKGPETEGEEEGDFEKWEKEVFPDVDIPGQPGPPPESRVDGTAAGKFAGEGITPLDVIRPGEVNGGGRSGSTRGSQRGAERPGRTM